eukprot:4313299-Amphidinium_carterae.4
MDLQAPVLCIIARKSVAVEGQGLCGKNLDEQAYQRLKTRLRNLGASHPLVSVVHSSKLEAGRSNLDESKPVLPVLTDRLVARVLQARRRHSCGLDAAEVFQSELGMDDLGEVCEILARRVRTQALGLARADVALGKELTQLACELEAKSIPDPVSIHPHAMDAAVQGLSMAGEHPKGPKGTVRFSDNLQGSARSRHEGEGETGSCKRSQSPEVHNPFRIQAEGSVYGSEPGDESRLSRRMALFAAEPSQHARFPVLSTSQASSR